MSIHKEKPNFPLQTALNKKIFGRTLSEKSNVLIVRVMYVDLLFQCAFSINECFGKLLKFPVLFGSQLKYEQKSNTKLKNEHSDWLTIIVDKEQLFKIQAVWFTTITI